MSSDHKSLTLCGLWPTPRHLIAVIVDETGHPHPPLTVAHTEAARTALVQWLADQHLHALVLTDDLDSHPLVELATNAGLRVWIAPRKLLDAIRAVARLNKRPHRYTAALLARWPTSCVLRPHLRHVEKPHPHPDQLQLL